jgi:gas vesicle protein
LFHNICCHNWPAKEKKMAKKLSKVVKKFSKSSQKVVKKLSKKYQKNVKTVQKAQLAKLPHSIHHRKT